MNYSHIPNIAELLSVFSKGRIDLYNEIMDSVQVGIVDRIRRGEMYRLAAYASEQAGKRIKKVPPVDAEKNEDAAIFYKASGSRKTARATVLLFPNGSGEFIVNGRRVDDYFEIQSLNEIARPLLVTQTLNYFNGVIMAEGGGEAGKSSFMPMLSIAHCLLLLLIDANDFVLVFRSSGCC